MHSQPIAGANDRPSSSRIQILHDVVVQQAVNNTSDPDNTPRYDMITKTPMDAPFLSGFENILAGANKLLHGMHK